MLESTGKEFVARPVIVFPGWFVENVTRKFNGVWVLEPKALPSFLKQEAVRLTSEEIKLASFHLSRFIRSSERSR